VKTSCFAVPACLLACLALAACDNSPKFDASSLPAYQKSLDAIKAQLSAHDRQRLDMALFTTAANNVAGVLPPEGPGVVVQASLVGVANPLIYLDRLRPRIAGRTAAKVIELAADDLDFAISHTGPQSAAADNILAAIAIENPRYYWTRDHQPTIDFSVANSSPYAIANLTVSGVLTVHGRVLLATGGLNYSFSPALQSGSQQSVSIRPYGSIWSNRSLETVDDANFALKAVNIVDTDRRRLLMVDADIVEAMKRKRDFLRSN
jgi:hypothetical protein